MAPESKERKAYSVQGWLCFAPQPFTRKQIVNTDLMFSSKTEMWSTPQDFFDALNNVFKFETDVCATNENAKCDRWFTPEMNALTRAWTGVCWMNPPYGREIGAWIKKAHDSAKKNGATVVCLVPARVDTKWWHEFCTKGEIVFLAGRLKFGGSKNSAPFPSAVVCFRPTVNDAIEAYKNGNKTH